jgi:hypothetical protein
MLKSSKINDTHTVIYPTQICRTGMKYILTNMVLKSSNYCTT